MFTGLSPMNPLDENVPFVADFSNVLGLGETIASVEGVHLTPESIDVGAGTVVNGARPGCAVQFTLGNGAPGKHYIISVSIVSTVGVHLTREASLRVST
jgi:hypothetical protein